MLRPHGGDEVRILSETWRRAPIVLVEDDQNDVFFVRHALDTARIGNPVVACRNAPEAKRALLERFDEDPPALLILDINLSAGETGIDLLRWVRGQAPPIGSTPAMLLTGSDRPGDIDEAQSLGATCFLVKPVTEARLSTAVQALGFVVMTSLSSGQMGFRIIERP
jgi:CheY-like chemotaxis protein